MTVAIHGVTLGGTGDLAERWGVTTQRVRQLAELDGFPEQLGTVNGNPVWDVDECDGWREIHRRGRGRPRKTAEELDEIAKGLRLDEVLEQTRGRQATVPVFRGES